MSRGFMGILGEGKLTEETLDDLEELLIGADINYEITTQIIEKIRIKCIGALLSNEELIQYLIQFTGEYIVEPEKYIEKFEDGDRKIVNLNT